MDGELTPHAEILTETEKRIGGFFYELANGLTNYRSLHSLTEQIEHQYHGRVIIEMLQNAHDALSPTRHAKPGRIEIRLVQNDGEFGALYVANDGAVFSRSNFNSLSQLGQSDKDPAQSIGNKGIGFRSVLEITSAPEIFSRASAASAHFDGYCFAFSPSVVEKLAQRILAIMGGKEAAHVVDWDEGIRAKFRDRVEKIGEEGVRRELRYLSPYLLPYPVEATHAGGLVQDFEKRGFATVIRLPLKASETTEFVRGKLRELESLTMIFLERASVLVLDDGNSRRELLREFRKRPATKCSGEQMMIGEKDSAAESYWLWSCELPIREAPADVQEAVQKLPGKWPQLEHATISIATRLQDNPKPGRLSIFLPTLKESGCGAHLNAPFFGDMSRTLIDFKNRYNQFLLEECAALALRVIPDELAGGGVDEGRAIIDLVAPASADGEAIARWHEALSRAALAADVAIDEAPWFFTDQGWRELPDAVLLPEMPDAAILTREMLRAHASFPVLVSGLDARARSIGKLYENHGFDAKPISADLANTVERIAQWLVTQPQADWPGFWTDAEKLFAGDSLPLKGKCILHGNDGRLHSTDENCAVFFGARQGQSDEDAADVNVDVVPDSLRPHVAFLSDKIVPPGKRDATPKLRKFLEGDLVYRFGVDDIFRLVLVKRTPPDHVALDDPRGALCPDLLAWALRLILPLVEQDKGGKSMRALGELRAPCRGGWFKLNETAFGPGWPGSPGDALNRYLRLLPRAHGKPARDRLLLPPDDPRWGGEGAAYQAMLRLAGVSDGLRLAAIASKDWSSRFQASQGSFAIPAAAPLGIGADLWSRYREFIKETVRPYYQKWAPYEVQTLHTFAGLEILDELDDETRRALMVALLDSMGGWTKGWVTTSFEKKDGNSDTRQTDSPLAFALRTTPWLFLTKNNTVEWFRPDERWHVPVLAGRAWQFSHLQPLPGDLAHRLDGNPPLAEALRALGMPRYDPETPSPSTRLLNDLAAALQRNDVPDRNVFLGQVRSAWDCFQPEPSATSPALLIVNRGGAAQLTTEQPSSENPIYLPDSTKSFAALEQFDLPLLAIEPSAARRLADWFAEAYGDAVCATSALKVVPFVQGTAWAGASTEALSDSEFAPLIPLILTVAAFAGTQSMGVGTRRFDRQVSTFRGGQIVWTADLRVALFRGAAKAAEPPIDALWLREERVLLAAEKCRSEPALLAEALTHLIERDDLEMPLKLVLQSLPGLDPDAAAIERALRLVKVIPERLEQVREHWRGDLGQTIRMLLPLLTLLRPEAELGTLAEAKTDAELERFIDELRDSRLAGSGVLRWCRTSADTFEFGKSAWHRFGDAVQLGAWNAILARRREAALLNREAPAEFRRQLSGALPLLRALVAAILRRDSAGPRFAVLNEALSAISAPALWESEVWEVDFAHVLVVTLPFFQRLDASPAELEAIRLAGTHDGLGVRLRQAGVDVGFDPAEAARVNREHLRNALERLQQVGLAWALATLLADPIAWESRVEEFMAGLSEAIEKLGYLKTLSETEVFALLRALPHDRESAGFWSAVAQAHDFPELIATLGLSEDALVQARERLRAFKEDVRRRHRMIEVGGAEFDSSEDNLASLYGHIARVLPDERLQQFVSIDLGNPSALTPISQPTRSSRDSNAPRPPVRVKRPSKAMEQLLGLAGEIHAFRMLRSRYPASQTSWISENGRKVFPENVSDDGRGCDFEIVHGNRTYFVEVKASEGDDMSFTLGSSELRLAKEVARRKPTVRKNEFMILHVTRVLSAQPVFTLLPNPCDPRNDSFFVKDEANVRIRYRT